MSEVVNERYEFNKNFVQMLKGGVIMDVIFLKEVEIVEKVGVVVVMVF